MRPADRRSRHGAAAARTRTGRVSGWPPRWWASASRGNEPEPVVDQLQRRYGGAPGPHDASGEDRVQLGGIVEVAQRPLPERRDEVDHQFREVLLEVSVTTPGV